MKRVMILVATVCSFNAFATTLIETYTFKTNYPLANGLIFDHKGNQYAIDCKTLEITFLAGQGTGKPKFKDIEECQQTKAFIQSASDSNPVEVDVSGNKVIQVRVHK